MSPAISLPAHLQSLLAREEENRALAWLDLTPDLLGVPVRPFTARMRHDLVLAGNAFMCGRRATAADVFDFLWRLSPHYAHVRRPWALRGTGPRLWCLWRAFGSLTTAAHFYLIERHVSRLPIPLAAAAIVDRLMVIFQDRPASSETEADTEAKQPSLLPPPRAHWLDDLVEAFTTRKGWTPDEVLGYPLARLFQLHRASLLARGQRPIDPSHGAIADWIFAEAKRLRPAHE